MPRPKGFERDVVLDQAMQLFWRRGYASTSIQDLEAELGINRTSLYREFGSKHALFLAALDRYRDTSMTAGLEPLLSDEDGLASIRRFLESTVESLSGGGYKSCLMSNSASELAVHDPDTAERTRAHMLRVEAAFRASLVRARELGELDADADLDGLARCLTTVQHGLGLIGKATGDEAWLATTVDMVMKQLE